MKNLIYILVCLLFAMITHAKEIEKNKGDLMKDMKSQNTEVATLGGGCFWCLQPVFERLRGVKRVEVGYSGGQPANPSYEQVSTGATGHAEVVEITFDPDIISYKDLLTVFFSVHDPTTLNRQGHDVGTQYRSIILFHSEDQKEEALNTIESLDNEGLWKHKIVTEVVPFMAFYKAEDYHQEYYENNKEAPYCQLIISPKIEKLYKLFGDKVL